MDVDTIDIGVEFKDAIESAVTACDVLFAMIGPRWLTVADRRPMTSRHTTGRTDPAQKFVAVE